MRRLRSIALSFAVSKASQDLPDLMTALLLCFAIGASLRGKYNFLDLSWKGENRQFGIIA
jgi:hypothetical protein